MYKARSVGRSVRNALAFLRGNVLVLALTRVLGMFGRSMTMPYASLYILALGGEPAQVGLVNSLAPLAGLLVFPIAGYISDHAGRVKLIGVSGLLSGLVFLIYIFAGDWRLIALGALLRGFMVIQFPPTSAIVADSLAPQDRGRGIATMNIISSAPAMLAPYVAGSLLEVWGVDPGMRYLYGFLMVASLVSAGINLRFLKETSERSSVKIGLSDLSRIFGDAYSGIPTMLRQFPRSLKALSVVIIFGFLANAVAGPFWVVYAVEHIGLSSVEWGTILLIETALRNIMYIPAGMAVDRYGRTRCILASLSLSLVSVPLFVFSAGFVAVMLVRASIAVSSVFLILACSALMADTTPRAIRGRAMAAIGRGTVMVGAASGGTGGPGLGFLATIPLMMASFSAGYLYDHDPTYPWFFAFGAILVSVAVTGLFVRDPENAEV